MGERERLPCILFYVIKVVCLIQWAEGFTVVLGG